MKCPKCGYISFDYNQVCPKCNKDITAEQSRMNLPSYKPAPPSLLGSLTGDASDSSIGLRAMAVGGGEGLIPEDSQALEGIELPFEDSPDLEIRIDASPEEGVHFQAAEDEIASLDLEDLSGDETEIAFDEEVTAGGEDAASDVEKVEHEADLGLDGEPTIIGDEETLFDRDQDLEISLEPEKSSPDFELEADEKETSIEPEEISLEDLEGLSFISETGDEKEEVSLDLDDLSIEEPEAEKEIVIDSTGEEEELMIDLDDFSLDESVPQAQAEPEEIPLDTGEMSTLEIDNKEVEP